MSDLLVRGIDEAVARALKERAASNGRSAEAEHRDILTAALTKARKRSFAQVLAEMPNVGEDADFERVAPSPPAAGAPGRRVYLIDTNVIGEARKQAKADRGVRRFFADAEARHQALFLSVVTVGELRRGVELIRHRGDAPQAASLERWLLGVLDDFRHQILEFDADAAQVWGRLRVPDPAHQLDKQIAAIALVHDLTVVTRNVAAFTQAGGVRLLNPFSAAAG